MHDAFIAQHSRSNIETNSEISTNTSIEMKDYLIKIYTFKILSSQVDEI